MMTGKSRGGVIVNIFVSIPPISMFLGVEGIYIYQVLAPGLFILYLLLHTISNKFFSRGGWMKSGYLYSVTAETVSIS